MSRPENNVQFVIKPMSVVVTQNKLFIDEFAFTVSHEPFGVLIEQGDMAMTISINEWPKLKEAIELMMVQS